jgi:hypothetical protein
VVKVKGLDAQLVQRSIRTGTVVALRAYWAARGLVTLDLVRDSALVLSELDGTNRHPERFSRRLPPR